MRQVQWSDIAAAGTFLVAGATGLMKTVDLVRSWCNEHLAFELPSYTWIAVPFGIGIATALTSHINALGMLLPNLPVHYSEVMTGIAMGAIASPLHHGTALLSAKSKSYETASDPVVVPETADELYDSVRVRWVQREPGITSAPIAGSGAGGAGTLSPTGEPSPQDSGDGPLPGDDA